MLQNNYEIFTENINGKPNKFQITDSRNVAYGPSDVTQSKQLTTKQKRHNDKLLK